jgi:two-component system cell cycle sensor histidine kinase/response regulator CckA
MNISIPQKTIQKWQEIVDLIAEIVQVPATRIMKVEPSVLAIFVASQSKGNPYKRGEKVSLNSGLYCETVIETRKMLIVQDALQDEKWNSNPDIEFGMISYLGLPITWPDGRIFGTICILDNKKNAYSDPKKRLLLQFRDVIESDLKILIEKDKNSGRPENILSHAIYAMDAQGFLTYLSPTFEQITGYSPDQMVGEHFSKLIHHDDLHIAKLGFEKAIAGISDIFELHVVGKEGKISLIRITTQPFQDDGHMKGIIGLATDITEQERVTVALQGNGEHYRTLLERAEPTISVVGQDGKFQFINQSGARLLGGTPENIQGKTMADLFPKKMAEGQMGDIRKALVTGKTMRSVRQSLVGNEMRWFEAHIQPLKGLTDEYDRCLVVIVDITEAKQTEEALRKSEEKYKTLFNSAADAIFIHDLDGSFLEVNDVACQRLGYAREELLRMKPIDIDTPEYASKVKGRIDDVIRVGYKIFESAQISRDGNVTPIELHARLIDYEGKKAILAVARDITERKQVEDHLIETKELLEKTFESLDTALFILDAGEKPPIIVESNKEASNIFGYEKDEMIGQTTEFLHENKETLAEFQKTLFTEVETAGYLSFFEFTMKRKSGEIFPSEHSVIPLRDKNGDITGWVSVVRDITERKQAEEQLKYSTEKYQNIISDLSDIVIMEIDSEGRFSYVSPQIFDIFGYTPDESVGQYAFDFVHPDDIERCLEAMATRDEVVNLEYRSRHKDGHYVDVSTSGKLVPDGRGGTKITSVLRDVTKYTKAEKALREAEARYSTLVESSKDGIIIIQDGVLKFVNTASQDLVGYTPEEMVGANFLKFLPPDSQDLIMQRYADRMAGKDVPSIYEIDVLRKDGTILPVELNASLVFFKGKASDLVFLRDVAERKKAEKTLQLLSAQAERMNAMSAMAAGVAHELNNPMMGILNFIQYCLKHTSEDDLRYPVLQDSQLATRHCIDIVKNMMTFSLTGQEDGLIYEKESITTIIGRVLRLLSYRIETEHVTITHNIAEELPEIWMKPSTIQQVFLNLIDNAMDALAECKEREIHIEAQPEGEFVQISVCDSGTGIAPESLERIWEPFFTTKPVGQGTGLGLSVSRNIINEHGGSITCKTTPGVGTTFSILLPIHARGMEEKKDD